MARPKTLKNPSKARLEREARREKRRSLRSRRGVFLNTDYWSGSGGGNGGTIVTHTTTTNSITNIGDYHEFTPEDFADLNGASTIPNVNLVMIESLDQGVTWHVAGTLEPVINRNGELVIGYTPSGPAPETMRPGSGNYRFTITSRWATQEESQTWWTERGVRQAEIEKAEAERKERMAKAAVRAKELLLSHLTDAQRQDYETKEGFWVKSQHGNMYWVTRRTAVMFDKFGNALQRYCIHAIDQDIPAEDNALARKLLLECNEEHFLVTANPGLPSEYDFSPPPPIVSLPSLPTVAAERGLVALPEQQQVLMQQQQLGLMNQQQTTGNQGYIRMLPPTPPILIYVNGVFRPLTG